MTENNDDIIANLILTGALEVAGMDIETGEPLYNFTSKLEYVNPELHSEMATYFTRETMALWQHGFIAMDVGISGGAEGAGGRGLARRWSELAGAASNRHDPGEHHAPRRQP